MKRKKVRNYRRSQVRRRKAAASAKHLEELRARRKRRRSDVWRQFNPALYAAWVQNQRSAPKPE